MGIRTGKLLGYHSTTLAPKYKLTAKNNLDFIMVQNVFLEVNQAVLLPEIQTAAILELFIPVKSPSF